MKIGEGFAGVGTSTARLVDQYYPVEKRIIDDRVIYRLLPFGWRVLVRLLFLPGLRQLVLSMREKRMPGSLGGFLCRARYIDDVLQQALSAELEQVVILGAGFDTRAYRVPGISEVRMFELDLPGAVSLKRKRVERVLGQVPGNVVLVPIDFETQDLAQSLKTAGYQEGKRNFFIWEGVTQYLTPEAVDDTLAFVALSSSSGSRIAFSWLRKGIIDGTERPAWLERFMPLAEKIGSPWLFGIDGDKLAQFLADRGLRLIEDVGTADYQKRYLNPISRKLSVFEGERMTTAEVMEDIQPGV